MIARTTFKLGCAFFKLGGALALLGSTNLTWADADIAVQTSGTLQTTVNVDLSVEVPQILIFGVGATGTTVAALEWTVDNAAGAPIGNNTTYTGGVGPFTAPAPLSTTADAAVASGGGTGASATGNQATLPVFLFSNSGDDITITTSVAGGATGGGTTNALDHTTDAVTIPISDFTGGDGGNISQPTLTNAASSTITAGGSVVNLNDAWTYSYTPSSTPTSGTYEARVTYVAAIP